MTNPYDPNKPKDPSKPGTQPDKPKRDDDVKPAPSKKENEPARA